MEHDFKGFGGDGDEAGTYHAHGADDPFAQLSRNQAAEETQREGGKDADPFENIFNDCEALIQFDEEELVRFSQLATFAEGNPRRLKRIVNSYMVSRALARPKDKEKLRGTDWRGFREKLVRWTFLCEMWPVRVSWILQLIADEQEHNLDMYNSNLVHGHKTVHDLYTNHVESRVYGHCLVSKGLRGDDHLPDQLAHKYADLYLLDGDPGVSKVDA